MDEYLNRGGKPPTQAERDNLRALLESRAEGHQRRMRQLYIIQELREQMAATEAVRDAALQALTESRARFGDLEQRIREKQAEAWDEGHESAIRPAYVGGDPNPYIVNPPMVGRSSGGTDG